MLRSLLAICLVVAFAAGTTVSGQVEFGIADLKLGELDGRTTVSLPECVQAWEVGAPAVPISVVHFVLPQDMKVTGVTIDAVETVGLEGKYDIYPVQPAVPLSAREMPPFVPPDPKYYSETAYPERVVTPAKQGSMFGYNVIGVFVAPVQYTASTGEVAFHTSVNFTLQLEPAELGYLRPGGRSPEAVRRIENQIAGFVINPDDVSFYAP
jgi:hypothetical protein